MFDEKDNRDSLLNLTVPEQEESIIKVIGVGGGGSNAVNHMCLQGIRGVEFVICNTDLQALRVSPVKNRIQIGKELTEGRGAGSLPERGKQSAIESLDYIRTILERNTKMVFITAGMGGGTGTGAAPVIAKLAKELDILTIAIVTIPFNFEGCRRVEQAMEGVDELSDYVDALLIICNEKLRDMCGNLKLSEAFAKADDVLTIAARSIAEIITLKGFVNVDFADVEVVMRNSGVALMGAGEGVGENRAMDAVKEALNSPLLNSNDIRGASNILLNMLYGSKEVTMDEITLITKYVKELVGSEVDVIWGAGKDDSLDEELHVAIIATGFHSVPVEKKKMRERTFKKEEVPDLEMRMMDAKKLEEEKHQKRIRQQELRRKREEEQRQNQERRESRYETLGFNEEKRKERAQERERKYEEDFERENGRKRGRNEVPDVKGWLQNKLGNFFNEDLNKDTDL